MADQVVLHLGLRRKREDVVDFSRGRLVIDCCKLLELIQEPLFLAIPFLRQRQTVFLVVHCLYEREGLQEERQRW